MFGPFNTSEAIARLATIGNGVDGKPLLRKVAGAAERAAAEGDAQAVAPSAYVLLAIEQPSPHTGGSFDFIQQTQVSFAVSICVKNYRADQLGEQMKTGLIAIVNAVRAKLLGWSPDMPGATSVECAGAKLETYDVGVLWWLEMFRFTYQITTR